MLKKVFILCLFVDKTIMSEKWLVNYWKNCNSLEKYGYYWKIFTNLPFKSKDNIDVVPFTKNDYLHLIEKKIGLKTTVWKGDHLPLYGIMFEDYLKDADFWGFTNFDVVYGRLDRFLPDTLLKTIDIFGNDPGELCGPFTLFRNNEVCNNLFKDYSQWQEVVQSGTQFYFDEIIMGKIAREAHKKGRIVFKSADHRVKEPQFQSHDKLSYHNPTPQIELRKDGTLWDKVKNIEIMMFHFNRLKEWPI